MHQLLNLTSRTLQNDASRLHVNFLTSQKISNVKAFFTSTGWKGMLERNDYTSITSIALFILSFLSYQLLLTNHLGAWTAQS